MGVCVTRWFELYYSFLPSPVDRRFACLQLGAASGIIIRSRCNLPHVFFSIVRVYISLQRTLDVFGHRLLFDDPLSPDPASIANGIPKILVWRAFIRPYK